AEIVQDVLGGDGFLADAAFREGNVFRDRAVEVMADHEHVEMLIQRVRGVGARRVGGAGQHVGQAGNLDDVRRVAATGALGVEGVDGAALEGGDGVFHK